MLPAYMQSEYDALSDYQRQKFHELVSWSNAGEPGQSLMSDMAYESILTQVKRLEAPKENIAIQSETDKTEKE